MATETKTNLLQDLIIGLCSIGNILPDLHKSPAFLALVKKAFDAFCLVFALCCPPVLVCLLIDPLLSLCSKLGIGQVTDLCGNALCSVIKPFDSVLDGLCRDPQIKKSLNYWQEYEKKLAA